LGNKLLNSQILDYEAEVLIFTSCLAVGIRTGFENKILHIFGNRRSSLEVIV